MNELDKAAARLDAFQDQSELMSEAFEVAGERIAEALENAAKRGELSFNELAETIARDLARLAIEELILEPLQGALGGGGNPQSSNPITVNMNLSGVSDAGSFQRSGSQITAALARAVGAGQRYL